MLVGCPASTRRHSFLPFVVVRVRVRVALPHPGMGSATVILNFRVLPFLALAALTFSAFALAVGALVSMLA